MRLAFRGVAGFAGLCLAAGAFAQSTGSGDALKLALNKGIGPFLIASFIGGLVALLTPCVFPMIPVTVSFFAKREKHHVAGAVAYCIGIVSTFAIVGVGAAAIFGAAGVGKFAANPIVNLALAIIFVGLALNLFGVYEFRVPLPAGLANASRSKASSLVAPYLMGVAFSLTSFTCTAPIAGALLVMSAEGKSLAYPAAGMTAFGVAFALPFFFLAVFPRFMTNLPKSGNWLSAVKPALGFIELAAAVKFLSNADLSWNLGLLTRPVFLATWTILALLLGAYLLGLPKALAKTGWVRRGLAIATLCLGAFMALGMRGTPVGSIEAYLPPAGYPFGKRLDNVPTTGTDGKTFLDTYEGAVKVAARLHRNVFVDFTGVNCVNCRWMEDNVFVLGSVQEQFAKMVRTELYTDRSTPSDQANQKLQQQLAGTIALPVYVIVTPEGKV
ncbi:MAG TPA: cytochrome c biogenesis protein CcdA, partial [Fimbriimonadaceae bacterium]|nr:cytochrome c biogenesis protein CcdA [Fimbriimonadaceae bacterium]